LDSSPKIDSVLIIYLPRIGGNELPPGPYPGSIGMRLAK